MEHIVSKINSVKYFTAIMLLVSNLICGQTYKKNKTTNYSYKGNSTREISLDSSHKLLINDVTKNIYFSTRKPSCYSEVGLFLFKVNSIGNVEPNDIKWFGDLLDSTRNDIISNIKSTSGKYKIHKDKSIKKYHWYLIEYFSVGYDSNCGGEEVFNATWELTNQRNTLSSTIRMLAKDLLKSESNFTHLVCGNYEESIKRKLRKRHVPKYLL
jgi:hypothetical protein